MGEEESRIVLAVLAKRGWQLVENEARFIEDVCAEVRQRASGDTGKECIAIERATIRLYCIVLHAACREHGSSRQRRAFEELWRYLYPIALYKTHDADLAQDVTQQALVKTWRKLGQCREPGSFLNYATLILINEIREYYRQQSRRCQTVGEFPVTESDMNRADSQGDENKFARLGDGVVGAGSPRPGSDTAFQAITDESQRELLAIIQRCLKSRQQQTVIVESFFNDKGYKEIAEQLGITINNVHVLKHRALLALRRCDQFIRFIDDASSRIGRNGAMPSKRRDDTSEDRLA